MDFEYLFTFQNITTALFRFELISKLKVIDTIRNEVHAMAFYFIAFSTCVLCYTHVHVVSTTPRSTPIDAKGRVKVSFFPFLNSKEEV